MYLNTTVTIQAKTTTYDSEGMQVEVWTASQTVESANKQFLSGEDAYKDYGISDAGETWIFFLKSNSVVAKNNRIVDSVGTFDVCAVPPWQNHKEAICRPAVT